MEKNGNYMVKSNLTSKPHLTQSLRSVDQNGNSSIQQREIKQDAHAHMVNKH